MKKHPRQFLSVMLALLLFAALLAGCSGSPASQSTPGAATSAPAASTGGGEEAQKEAPALAAMVQAGTLPPLEERLPANPLVLTPVESVGTYGGTWNQSITIGYKSHAFATIGYYSGRNLITWSIDQSEFMPNLAESWSVNDDYTVFTYKLREGLKWSDGEPFTSADFQFRYDAIHMSEVFNPGRETQDIQVEVTTPDELTIVYTYNQTQPLAMYAAAYYAINEGFLPAHYMSQFHPDYSPDAEANAKAAGFDSWDKMFDDRKDYMINPDLPTMAPFVLTTDGHAATQLRFVRNPYYWAVDTDGKQLPYIDECIMNIVETNEIVKMKAIAGETDIAIADFFDTMQTAYPLYAENMESGNYQLFFSERTGPNALNLQINQANQDVDKRDIVTQPDFRKAVSLALNRQTIIDTFYTVGPYKGTPRQYSPCVTSPYYNEEMSNNLIEFDPDTANEMLDALGLDKRNADGWRLMPNGKVLDFVIMIPSVIDTWYDIGLLMAENLKAVGINASASLIDTGLWGERLNALDWDATVFSGDGGLAALSAEEVAAITGYTGFNFSWLFQLGNITYRNTEGEQGVEPVEAVSELWRLGNELVVSTDEAERDALLEDIFQVHIDNLFVIGTTSDLPAIYLVKNNIRNVPALNLDWNYGCGGHGRPEQYYFE